MLLIFELSMLRGLEPLFCFSEIFSHSPFMAPSRLLVYLYILLYSIYTMSIPLFTPDIALILHLLEMIGDFLLFRVFGRLTPPLFLFHIYPVGRWVFDPRMHN